MNAVLEAAYGLAASRQMCCRADLDLLIKVMDMLPSDPVVVQLGAGSGTMALAIMGQRRDATLWSFDTDPQALGWERQVFINAQVELLQQAPEGHWRLRYTPRVKNSWVAGWDWCGPNVDLVIVDADHSYGAVIDDVQAWYPKTSLLFIHDYDGTTAPQQYPGVRKACDQLWPSTKPVLLGGWSAVFRGERLPRPELNRAGPSYFKDWQLA